MHVGTCMYKHVHAGTSMCMEVQEFKACTCRDMQVQEFKACTCRDMQVQACKACTCRDMQVQAWTCISSLVHLLVYFPIAHCLLSRWDTSCSPGSVHQCGTVHCDDHPVPHWNSLFHHLYHI